MSTLSDAFDHWIRGSFMEINTELENLYFAQDDRADVSRCGANLKSQLRDEGHVHVVALLAEGDTGDGFETAFGVLGNVGMYLAALRRHELTNPAREERSPFPEASSLAMHVGAALGMAPRFSTAHIAHLNFAHAGVRKSFTSLPDEILFIDENTRGILLLQLAADALAKVVPLGISSPIVDVPFAAARHALEARHRIQPAAVRQARCRALLLLRAALLQALHGGTAGVSRRERRRLLRHQRARPAARPVPRQRSVLRAVARRQDVVHAAGRTRRGCVSACGTKVFSMSCWRWRRQHAREDWFRRNARAYLELCELFGRYASQHHD